MSLKEAAAKACFQPFRADDPAPDRLLAIVADVSAGGDPLRKRA